MLVCMKLYEVLVLQVIILNMLLRYARSQFLDPNAGSDDWEGEVADNKNFYGDDSDQVKY